MQKKKNMDISLLCAKKKKKKEIERKENKNMPFQQVLPRGLVKNRIHKGMNSKTDWI